MKNLIIYVFIWKQEKPFDCPVAATSVTTGEKAIFTERAGLHSNLKLIVQ